MEKRQIKNENLTNDDDEEEEMKQMRKSNFYKKNKNSLQKMKKEVEGEMVFEDVEIEQLQKFDLPLNFGSQSQKKKKI